MPKSECLNLIQFLLGANYDPNKTISSKKKSKKINKDLCKKLSKS